MIKRSRAINLFKWRTLRGKQYQTRSDISNTTKIVTLKSNSRKGRNNDASYIDRIKGTKITLECLIQIGLNYMLVFFRVFTVQFFQRFAGSYDGRWGDATCGAAVIGLLDAHFWDYPCRGWVWTRCFHCLLSAGLDYPAPHCWRRGRNWL